MLTKEFIEDKWESITFSTRGATVQVEPKPMLTRFGEFIFMILATPFLIILDIVLSPIELSYYLFVKWMKWIEKRR